eukprot:TRINITY_DN1877_c0_g1_i1.p1 TRINITY_DN1877_c0_g1~~TRINITY_DN1877_c0_g1_i1.p1  ORF type:complete len:390 (-),score=23.94 TRINITY_DN1877_c0_g1_i1:151-1203(-)
MLTAILQKASLTSRSVKFFQQCCLSSFTHSQTPVQNQSRKQYQDLSPCLSNDELKGLCEQSGLADNKLLAVKILLYPADIGLLLRSWGSNIAQVLRRCNVGYVLSWDGEYFPATNKRVLLLNGKGLDVLNSFAHFLPLLHEERNARFKSLQQEVNYSYDDLQIVLVIPDQLSWLLIGSNNAIIDKIKHESGITKLSIQDKQDLLPMITDRLIYMSGSPAAIVKCITSVLGKISSQVLYLKFQEKHPSEHTEIKWVNQLILNALQSSLLGKQIKYSSAFALKESEIDQLLQDEHLEPMIRKFVPQLDFIRFDQQELQLQGGYTSIQRAIGLCISRLQAGKLEEDSVSRIQQ